MQTHDIGDIVTVSALFQVETVPGDESTLTPADPTTITLRVRKPSGLVVVYVFGVGVDVVKDSVGNYHVNLAVPFSGIWRHRWEGTGAAADNADGQFFVRPSVVVAG